MSKIPLQDPFGRTPKSHLYHTPLLISLLAATSYRNSFQPCHFQQIALNRKSFHTTLTSLSMPMRNTKSQAMTSQLIPTWNVLSMSNMAQHASHPAHRPRTTLRSKLSAKAPSLGPRCLHRAPRKLRVLPAKSTSTLRTPTVCYCMVVGNTTKMRPCPILRT